MIEHNHDNAIDSRQAACTGEGDSLLGVNVHQLELKVADALLAGRLKHECDRVPLILRLQCNMHRLQASFQDSHRGICMAH